MSVAVHPHQIGPGYGPPTPVPIFQWEDEFLELLTIYKEHAPARMLEIGTYHGGTLYHWLRNAEEGTIVVSVDLYDQGLDNRSLYEGWCPPGVRCIPYRGSSFDHETIERVRVLGPYDFIFIDAGHYYREVSRDWRNYGPMCSSEGIVAFHDIITDRRHPEIEVERLWREIQREGYLTREIVADPDAPWGGIGCVFMCSQP